jgi:hypothetical protein
MGDIINESSQNACRMIFDDDEDNILDSLQVSFSSVERKRVLIIR